MTGVVDEHGHRVSASVIYADHPDTWIDKTRLLIRAVAPEHPDAAIRLYDSAIVPDDRLAKANADSSRDQATISFADRTGDTLERRLFPVRYAGRVVVVDDGSGMSV